MRLARIDHEHIIFRDDGRCAIAFNHSPSLQNNADGEAVVDVTQELMGHVHAMNSLNMRQIRET